jgi:hypothetical protein
MRGLVGILLAMALPACASTPDAASGEQAKALFVGKVESSKYLATLQEVMPALSGGETDQMWHGEIYEVKLKVLDRISGGPVARTVTVKLTGHARRFEGMTLAVMTDPDLTFYGVDLGTSWWDDLSPEYPTLCVPDDLLHDEAFEAFMARARPVDDSHCMDIL